ncbi:hypothetical protein LR002_01400 [Candidatus Gracilibacteria bacterium]|nr:hypothetical protein [Candidatus Gracilibacteria bacterium]
MKKFFLSLTIIFLNVQEIFGATLDDLFGDNKPKHLAELSSVGDGKTAVLTLISQVVDLMLYFAGTIAVGFLIYGGIRLITDFGTDSGKEDAKKIVLHSIIGLLVIFISIILIENTERFVRFVVGSGGL